MAPRTAILAAGLLLGLNACATTVAVAPGHRAVWMDASGALQILDEGAYSLPVSAAVDDFDLRQRAQAKSFGAITADGARILVREPEVSYSLEPSALVAIDRELGPEGAGAIIDPTVASISARVLAGYRWAELDSAHIREAQARIVALAAAALRPRHIDLQSVELKALVPQLPGLAQAVVDTSVWEQRSAQAQSRLELARQQAEHLRAQSSGVADANQRVAPTLTPGVVQDKADKAWQQLLAAPSTSIEITDSNPANLEITP